MLEIDPVLHAFMVTHGLASQAHTQHCATGSGHGPKLVEEFDVGGQAAPVQILTS